MPTLSTTQADELAKLRKKYAEQSTSEQSLEFIGLKDGEAMIARILPPMGMPTEGVHFEREIGKHFELGPDRTVWVFCPRICEGQPCPICEKGDELRKGTAEQKALASACKPQRYFLLDLLILHPPSSKIDYSKLEPSAVKIYQAHGSELDELRKVSLMPDYGPIWNLKEGVPFYFDCQASRKPMFSASAQRNSYPVPEEYLELRHNFDEVVQLKPYEYLAEVLSTTELRPKVYNPQKGQ